MLSGNGWCSWPTSPLLRRLIRRRLRQRDQRLEPRRPSPHRSPRARPPERQPRQLNRQRQRRLPNPFRQLLRKPPLLARRQSLRLPLKHIAFPRHVVRHQVRRRRHHLPDIDRRLRPRNPKPVHHVRPPKRPMLANMRRDPRQPLNLPVPQSRRRQARAVSASNRTHGSGPKCRRLMNTTPGFSKITSVPAT